MRCPNCTGAVYLIDGAAAYPPRLILKEEKAGEKRKTRHRKSGSLLGAACYLP
jgi:hypothetical protein